MSVMGFKRCNDLKSAMCSTYNRLITIIQCHDEFFLWQEYLDDRLLPDVTLCLVEFGLRYIYIIGISSTFRLRGQFANFPV